MKRVAVAVVLLALVGVAACGEQARQPETVGEYDPLDRTTVPVVPAGRDVLQHLAAYPGTGTIRTGDDPWRKPKYGDHHLEQAEEVLTSRHPRPWTVERLLAWYREATPDPPWESRPWDDPKATPAPDAEHRAALVYLLAASRDPRGLAVAGPALGDAQIDVRVAATFVIQTYWQSRFLTSVGLEGSMHEAATWWNEHGKAIARAVTTK